MDFPVFDSVFIYLRRKNVLSEIFKKVFSCFLKFFKKSVDKCYENEYNNFCSREIWLINKEIEAWLSLVERCVRDAEAAGSNPVNPTIEFKSRPRAGSSYVCLRVGSKGR